MILDELVAFSNYYGQNEELVLAGGGNTSAKDGDYMYIKGSGTALATITADGFVKMDRKKLSEVFLKEYPEDDKEREAQSLAALFSARAQGEEKRPSVETLLHSLFEFKFVLHLHPSLINGLTCSKEGADASKRLFGDRVLWIEPCRPGYILAKICLDALKEYKEKNGKPCDMMLLANHGVFVAADTVEGLDEKLSFILEGVAAENKHMPSLETGEFYPDDSNAAFEKITEVYNKYGEYIVICEPNRESIELAKSKESAEGILKPFTPDHIVYCKPFVLYCESADEIEGGVEGYLKKNGFLPKIILVKNCGYFAVDTFLKGVETASLLFCDALKIASFSKSFGGPRFMSDELTDFIVNWEAESYRSSKN